MEPDHPYPAVLICGAGPTGLMMACQLAIRDIPFRIIDKNDGPSEYSGALFIQSRTLELLDQLNLARTAMDQGIIASKINILVNGKFISEMMIHDFGDDSSKFPFILMLEQSKTERILIGFLKGFNTEVERSTELIGFSTESDHVKVVLKDANGQEEQLNVRYLIGADGSRSLVRNILQIPFPGKTYKKHLFIIDSRTTLKALPGDITFAFSQEAAAGFFSLRDHSFRTDGFIHQNPSDKVTFHKIRQYFSGFTGLKLSEPSWFSVFHAQRRAAGCIYRNCCFLLGDAARVHTPIGAQGMNTGLQDAWNLGWKVALVLQGKAGTKLLKTYPEERLRLKGIAGSADVVYQILTGGPSRAFRTAFLARVLRWSLMLIKRSAYFRLRLYRNISQISIHYHNTSLMKNATIGTFPSHSPRPGDRLPSVNYIRNHQRENLYDSMKGTGFHLLLFAPNVPLDFCLLSDKYNLKIHHFLLLPETSELYRIFGITKQGYYLVRPDLYIAFRSEGLDPAPLENYIKNVTR